MTYDGQMLASGGSVAAGKSGKAEREYAEPCRNTVVTNDNAAKKDISAADNQKNGFHIESGVALAASSGTGGPVDLSNHDTAFNKLYLEYYGPLTSHVQKVIGSREDASDIVHTLFLDLIEKKRLEGLENPKAYLYRAARNAAASHFRTFHSKRITGLGPDEEADDLLADEDAVCAEAKMIRAEERQQVIVALARLKDRERRAIEGFYILGRQWKDVADDLGVSVSTAKSEARCALWMLRLELGREG